MFRKILLKIYYLKIFSSIEKYFYLIGSRRPWSIGYLAYRNELIYKIINLKREKYLDNCPDGYGFGLDERVVEYPWILQNIPKNALNIFDAGSVLNYDFILKSNQLHGKNILISNLNPEDENFNTDSISYLYGYYGDLRSNIIKNGIFDVVVCGSVIEHIGMDNTKIYSRDNKFKENKTADYIKMVKEFKRILKKDGVCLITVPFGVYSNYGWLQVFDKSMVENICEVFGIKNSSVEFFKYSKLGWKKSNYQGCRNATYFDIHKSNKIRLDNMSAAESVACIKLLNK